MARGKVGRPRDRQAWGAPRGRVDVPRGGGAALLDRLPGAKPGYSWAMARLDARPEARTFSVEQLLGLVARGAIRNPDFQRAVHWKRRNVLELFDSIYRGFPVGTLLFSKRAMPAAQLDFGPYHLAAGAVADAFLVVDGQQRIQALAGALLHPEPVPRGGAHAVWFDLEREEFFVPSRAPLSPLHVPANVLASSAKLHRWALTQRLAGVHDALVDRAFELGARVREFHVPAYVLEDASESALRQVFQRVNVSGVQMKEAEVFDALFATADGKPIASACARLAEETAFGTLEDSVFLRCMKMVEGNMKRGVDGLDVEVGDDQRALVATTREALANAIRLLIEDARIPHYRLLPYQLPLLVLARFFRHHPDPSPRARALLVRWVWRGILSFSHGDNSDAVLGRLVKIGQGSDEMWALSLLGTTEGEPQTLTASEPWKSGARLNACLIALVALAQAVREPATSDPLLDRFQEMLLDRLANEQPAVAFPDAFETKHSVVARAIAAAQNDLSRLKQADLDELAMHGIDEVAQDAWRRGDDAAFVAARAVVLDAHFAAFFAGMTGPRDDDRLSVHELVRHAEEVLAAP